MFYQHLLSTNNVLTGCVGFLDFTGDVFENKQVTVWCFSFKLFDNGALF